MFVDFANAWLDLILAFGAVVVLVIGLHRWANRKFEARIVETIRSATHQIQPGTNGGSSLSDLHSKVDGICVDMLLLKNAVLQLEEDVENIQEEVEELL